MTEENSEIKAEIAALETVMSALAKLEDATRRRVLGYVEQRFRLSGGEAPTTTLRMGTRSAGSESVPSEAAPTTGDVRDVRTLKERKEPKSAVEMAVLVAYYLSEVAKAPERKTTIGTADLTKYFKHADYRLPSEPRIILHQAKNAGYLDSEARGQYSLNPVGYNLVTHGLPRRAGAGSGQGRGRSKIKAQKKVGVRRQLRPKRKIAAKAKSKQARKKH